MAKVGAQPGAPPPRLVWYNDWRQVAAPALGAFTPELPVSVVVPYCAQPQELARTLAALERQTYPRELFEVVVVDDGSPQPLARPRSTPLDLKVARQEDLGFGLARARNTGARAAAHDVLLFLDADMLPEAGWLAAHARWHHAGAGRGDPGLAGPRPGGRGGRRDDTEPAGNAEGAVRGAGGRSGVVRALLDPHGRSDVEGGRSVPGGGERQPGDPPRVLRSGGGVRRVVHGVGRGGCGVRLPGLCAGRADGAVAGWVRLAPRSLGGGTGGKGPELDVATGEVDAPDCPPRLPHRPDGADLHGAAVRGDDRRGGLASEKSAGSGRAYAVRSGARSGGAAGVARRPCGPGVAGAPFGAGPQGAGGAELQGGGGVLPRRAGGVSRVPVPGCAACGVAAAWGHGARAARRTGGLRRSGGRCFPTAPARRSLGRGRCIGRRARHGGPPTSAKW